MITLCGLPLYAVHHIRSSDADVQRDAANTNLEWRMIADAPNHDAALRAAKYARKRERALEDNHFLGPTSRSPGSSTQVTVPATRA